MDLHQPYEQSFNLAVPRFDEQIVALDLLSPSPKSGIAEKTEIPRLFRLTRNGLLQNLRALIAYWHEKDTLSAGQWRTAVRQFLVTYPGFRKVADEMFKQVASGRLNLGPDPLIKFSPLAAATLNPIAKIIADDDAPDISEDRSREIFIRKGAKRLQPDDTRQVSGGRSTEDDAMPTPPLETGLPHWFEERAGTLGLTSVEYFQILHEVEVGILDAKIRRTNRLFLTLKMTADDLMSIVWMKFFGDDRSNVKCFSSWLNRVGERCFIDARRKSETRSVNIPSDNTVGEEDTSHDSRNQKLPLEISGQEDFIMESGSFRSEDWKASGAVLARLSLIFSDLDSRGDERFYESLAIARFVLGFDPVDARQFVFYECPTKATRASKPDDDTAYLVKKIKKLMNNLGTVGEQS